MFLRLHPEALLSVVDPRGVDLRGIAAGLLITAVFVVSAPSGVAQDGGDDGFGPPKPAAGPQPQAEIQVVEHEWARALQGDVVTHTFPVRNRGTSPLRILKVKSNCGCTSKEFTREIAPGEVGSIELLIDTGELGGGFHRKNATVFTNDPAAGQIILWMRGEVVPLLKAPASFLQVKGLCREPKEAIFHFTPGTAHPTEAISARMVHGRLEVADFDPDESGGVSIRLTSGPQGTAELVRDELRILVKVGEREPIEAIFPVALEHLDPIRVTPGGNIVFYRRHTAHLEKDPTREVTQEIQLRSLREDLPFQVHGVRIEGAPEGLFSAIVRPEVPGQLYVVTIRVLKTIEESQAKGRLVIDVDDPARPTREKEVIAQFRMRSSSQ